MLDAPIFTPATKAESGHDINIPFETMQQIHIRRPAGHYGEYGYGYGLGIIPDFLGHELIGHGGSIVVTTAYMAYIPDLRAGVVMMGNSSGMNYPTIAESVFAASTIAAQVGPFIDSILTVSRPWNGL